VAVALAGTQMKQGTAPVSGAVPCFVQVMALLLA
jgi:hypothetical protein